MGKENIYATQNYIHFSTCSVFCYFSCISRPLNNPWTYLTIFIFYFFALAKYLVNNQYSRTDGQTENVTQVVLTCNHPLNKV